MAVMMSGGIWLRSSGIAPDRFIAVFYTGLGASLLTAGIRFGYQFVMAVIAAGEEKTAFQDEKETKLCRQLLKHFLMPPI